MNTHIYIIHKIQSLYKKLFTNPVNVKYRNKIVKIRLTGENCIACIYVESECTQAWRNNVLLQVMEIAKHPHIQGPP